MRERGGRRARDSDKPAWAGDRNLFSEQLLIRQWADEICALIVFEFLTNVGKIPALTMLLIIPTIIWTKPHDRRIQSDEETSRGYED